MDTIDFGLSSDDETGHDIAELQAALSPGKSATASPCVTTYNKTSVASETRNFKMDTIDFGLSSDDETGHDIAELQAALSPGKSSAASPCITTDNETSVASETVRPASIDTALQLNRTMDKMYMKLQEDLSKRLNVCQRRLELLKDVLTGPNAVKYCPPKWFSYIKCGIPYFKDQGLFPSPINKDTQSINESHLMNYIKLPPVTSWTTKDKNDFEKAMVVVSRNRLENIYLSKIRNLNRQIKTLPEGSELQGKKARVLELEEQIAATSSLNLRELTNLLTDHDGNCINYNWEEVVFICKDRHNTHEYKAMWHQYMHPAINRNPWTKAEHTKLQIYARLHNMQNWDTIASQLRTNRTAYQCFVYYKTNIITNNGLKWSKEEDTYLNRIVEICRVGDYIPWSKVSFYFENRTKTQIYHRWKMCCMPEYKKGRFLREEDDVLLASIHKFGLDFKKASTLMPHRSRTQLKQRYYESLKNNTSASWSVDEDQKLLQLVSVNSSESLTVNFASIVKFFPGKNRANLRLRYMTLRKWLTLNPIGDIKDAPRRKARVKRKRRIVDLETALSILKKKLRRDFAAEPEVDVGETVDDHLITFFINELNDSEECQTVEPSIIAESQHEMINDGDKLPQTKMSVLNNILLLLGANIELESFCTSFKPDSALRKLIEYQSVDCVIEKPEVKTIRTYSRANKIAKICNEKIVRTEPISIWSDTPTLNSKYVLPPNFATILALKKIMIESSSSQVETTLPGFATLNKTLYKEYTNRWFPRFQMLFMLPVIISDIAPRSDHNFFDTTTDCALAAPSPTTYYYVPFEYQIKEGEARKKQKTEHAPTSSILCKPSCSKDINR